MMYDFKVSQSHIAQQIQQDGGGADGTPASDAGGGAAASTAAAAAASKDPVAAEVNGDRGCGGGLV